MRRGLLAVALALMAHVAQAAADRAPTSPAEFTRYASTVFAAGATDGTVRIVGALQLEIRTAGSGGDTVYLDTIYSFCLRSPDLCPQALKSHARKLVAGYRDMNVPPDRTKLRAVLRPVGYVDQLRQV